MLYIALGIIGFGLIHLFDLVALKRWPVAKPIAWFAGCACLLYAIVMVCLVSPGLIASGWPVIVGWVLLPAGLALQGLALFINLPFNKTYVDRGVGTELVTTGLYGLVRHPGVYGFILSMIGLVLVSGSKLMLLAGVVWTVVDIILVIVQDRYLFRRMFPGYAAYSRNTPMLVPNWHSVSGTVVNFKLSNLDIGKAQKND